MDAMGNYFLIFISVYSMVAELEAVTVSPALCPTNKIAPHRRQASWDQSRPRTLGLIFDLFGHGGPHRPQLEPVNDLQEQPQEDEQDDCGEIEDYDETDLSSITPTGARRKIDRNDRHFLHNNYIQNYYPGPNRPPYPPYRPQRPSRPQRPTRPPYNFEGNYPNGYRPPSQQYPGDYVKPVKEDTMDHPQADYRPGLVGGLLGHVVGFPSVRPPTEEPPSRELNSKFRFPETYSNPNRRQTDSQKHKSTNIFGSFVDLFFH